MGSHRIHHDLYRGPKLFADPGNGKTIRVNSDLQVCEMVSVGADETRTLAPPTKAGIRFVLRMLTDGGDIVVTAAAGLNVALETEATFADASDFLSLLSVSLTATTYRWEILEGNVGTVVSSASSSSSPSTSPSASSSASPSTSPSATPSSSPSTSASASPSSSPSPSASPSASASSSPSAS